MFFLQHWGQSPRRHVMLWRKKQKWRKHNAQTNGWSSKYFSKAQKGYQRQQLPMYILSLYFGLNVIFPQKWWEQKTTFQENEMYIIYHIRKSRIALSKSGLIQGVRGSPAHTLWSHKYTQAQFCIIFSTQSHLRTQTGVTCAHSHFPESPAHTDWSHKYTQAQFCIIFSTQSHPRTHHMG